MAQKATKTLAAKNTATLNRTHSISLGVYGLFFLLRLLLLHRSLWSFTFLTLPALVIEFYFERLSRPTLDPTTKDLKRAGEDLEAKGLTEWMWDVLYWTWGNVILVVLFGDRAWWLYLVVPGYSAYLAVSTYLGMRSGFGGLSAGAGGEGAPGAGAAGQSKRQAKMEKRGGQQVRYR
ncbi:SRP-independent targeting protein 2 [Teratosphaeria destructans]|uniref:SRP-independent targeting protein 2 n=1 Tax=Teratosphaeria destructans TaxID=418781 RepID=A0A9W7SPU5_9PEZI|nr:SRP-independent targeting protein 2 [Teratosphaeria destructans]